MSWRDNLLDCTFRGIAFDVVRVGDSASRAVAEHAYPYLDGADVEDLGRDARRVQIEAILYGDDYDLQLQELLAALDTPGAGELVHPVFGTMRVQVRRYDIRHDAEATDQCTLSIEFSETRESAAVFSARPALQKAQAIGLQGDAARDASAAATGDVVDKARAANPLSVFARLRGQMNDAITAARREVRGALTSGLDAVSEPRAWANDLSALSDDILDTRDWLTRSLTSDYDAVKNAFGRVRLTLGALGDIARLLPGGRPTEDQSTAAAQATIAVVTASGLAGAAQAVLTSEATTPSLTPSQIEDIATDTRSQIDDAIERTRAIHPLDTAGPIIDALRAQALAVQDAAAAIIEARPPLITRTLDAPGNLRLIAHRWYGDHTRAPELWRLNLGRGLRRPNDLTRGDRLYGFAA